MMSEASSNLDPDLNIVPMQTDCKVPGFVIGDTVYIRGRIVGFCKCPWGYGAQIIAAPIDRNGARVPGATGAGTYFVDPRHAVAAPTVTAEIKASREAEQKGPQS